jgi:hypothetical protein
VTTHFTADRNDTDGLSRYTACGQAAQDARYSVSAEPSKVTCKRCLHRIPDLLRTRSLPRFGE